MSKIFAFFWNLITKTIPTWLTRPAPPLPPPATPTPAPVDVHANLVQLILANTESIGPMIGTGGTIHRVDATTADEVATLIIADAKTAGVRVSLVASTIRSESDFDPGAIDPNDQDAVPGETAIQADEHADLGDEQEDVSTAEGDPVFRGLTIPAIMQKLLDPVYGTNFVATTVAGNVTWALAQFKADPTLASRVPNGDHLVLAMQAYNSGRTGALAIANTKGLAGNWSYGTGIVSRAIGWASLLDA